MQHKNKVFTFPFPHSTKSNKYIRRFGLSKKSIQNISLSVILILGFSLFGIGIFGVFNNNNSTGLASSIINPASNPLSAKVYAQTNAINYSRPDASGSLSLNSGGPIGDETAADEASIEKQLRALQLSSDTSRIPIIWAHSGKINNEFGFRRNPFGGRTYEFHSGMDIDGNRGDLVVAPASGTVIMASWQGGYGNMVEIDHGNGLVSRYGHLSKIEVEMGQPLQRGQLMGFVGSTGRSTGPHLHYELRFNDTPINPRRFLPPEPTEIRKIAG